MGFWTVNGVMFPSTGLLDADGTPFVFGEETCLWESFGEFFGEDYMSYDSYGGGRRICETN